MSTEKAGPFGGLSASEAGRLSWEKRRDGRPPRLQS